jgi:tetratricopeptide (TPR) repeat protein
LVDKSLVQRRAGSDHQPRFGMLETIREFAWERLAATDEVSDVSARHAAYFLTVVEEAEPALLGPDQRSWLERLEAEHDNLRAALDWALGSGRVTTSLRLAAALWRFWSVHGHLVEGRAWLERALALAPVADPALVDARAAAKALHGAGALAFRQGDFAAAQTCFEASIARGRASNDRRGLALSLAGLAAVVGQSNLDGAVALLTESRQLYRGLDDDEGIANVYLRLGRLCTGHGQLERAVDALEESVVRYRRLGQWRGLAGALTYLGAAVAALGSLERAECLHRESLALFRELGERWGAAETLARLADLARQRNEFEPARAYYQECLALRRALGDKAGVATCLDGLAAIALGQGDAEQTAELLGAAAACWADTGTPTLPAVRDARNRTTAAARLALGERAFAIAWQRGETMAAGSPCDPSARGRWSDRPRRPRLE